MRSSNEVLELIDRDRTVLDGVDPDIQRRFRGWVVTNIHVVNRFEKYALELRRSGDRDHYGAKTITERLRWDTFIAESGKEYKINNNYASCLSRVVMALNSELRGMFRVRCREAA